MTSCGEALFISVVAPRSGFFAIGLYDLAGLKIYQMSPVGREVFAKFRELMLFGDTLRDRGILRTVIENGGEVSVHRTMIL